MKSPYRFTGPHEPSLVGPTLKFMIIAFPIVLLLMIMFT